MLNPQPNYNNKKPAKCKKSMSKYIAGLLTVSYKEDENIFIFALWIELVNMAVDIEFSQTSSSCMKNWLVIISFHYLCNKRHRKYPIHSIVIQNISA